MKSKIIFICIAFLSTITIAQSKVGTIDSEYIIQLMPETQTVLKMSKEYGAKLDSSFSIKVKEYQNKVTDFKKEEKTLGPLLKKTIVKEITDLELEIKKYRENGTKLMQLKSNELMRPLYKKLNDAINAFAKDNGYTQILTLTGNEFAYIDEKFDITNSVIMKLGIKIPEVKN